MKNPGFQIYLVKYLYPQSQSQTPPGQPPVHPQVHHCPWTATLTKKVFTELSFFKSQVTSLQELVVSTIIPNASAPSPTPTQSAQLIPQPYHQPLVFLIRLSCLLLLTQKVHHLPLEEVLPHHQPQHSLSSLNPQLEQPLLIQMLHDLLQTILAEKVPRHLSLLQEHPQDKPPPMPRPLPNSEIPPVIPRVTEASHGRNSQQLASSSRSQSHSNPPRRRYILPTPTLIS